MGQIQRPDVVQIDTYLCAYVIVENEADTFTTGPHRT